MWTFVCVRLALIFLCVSSFATIARADRVILIPRASEWKFFPGLADPAGDPVSWREADFADDGWPSLPAPFGFRDGPFGTDLSEWEPPMEDNYSSIFLRREFQIENFEELFELHVLADYDDGFVAWINGKRALTVNLRSSDDDPTFASRALRGHESGEYEMHVIENPRELVVEGRNVLAIQALNISRTSNDFKIDVELVDPFGPDKTAPQIKFVAPGRGTIVRELDAIQIAFDEIVLGVDASDLLVNGQPAQSVEGENEGPYLFSFPTLDPGPVEVRFADNHGIIDAARFMNAFGGESWSYVVDPDAPPANLVINEILASNFDITIDESQRTPDWIEIVNEGAAPADLGGWALSDDPENPAKWVFPTHVLAPGDFLVVVASGQDIRDLEVDGFFHTNFRLQLDGEFLGLFSADLPRERVSGFEPEFPPQRGDISYGRVEGGAFRYFETPTPGEANSGASSVEGLVSAPMASHARGFYNTAFELELSSTTGNAEIRYTLDGSWPTPEEGSQYEGPITIAGTTNDAVINVRAIAYRDGFLPSKVSTFTYLFPDHVLTQPQRPEGWPTRWGRTNVINADYEMDPQVLANDEIRARAIDGLLSIPTLSVSMDIDDFLSPTTGIYSNGSSSGIAWERACSAEFIYGDGKEGAQIDCGIRIQGGSSTNNWKSRKLSMRLLFKGDYGKTKLEHAFFPNWDVERFDTLVLDAGLNLVLSHPDHGQRNRLQYVRDQYVSDIQILTGNLAPQGRFVNLFINGIYWGLYNVHEKPDANFLEAHYGGEDVEWDALRHGPGTPVDGNALEWNRMMGVMRGVGTDGNRLLALNEHLDLQGHIDYMLCNIFVGNTDWAHHNWYASRRRLPGHQWRFHSWDAEHSIKSVTQNSLTKNDGNSPTEIFSRLRSNPEYRLMVADRVHEFFSEGPDSIFYVNPESPQWNENAPENNVPASIYMKRIRQVDTPVILECARWGDHFRAQPYTRDREWVAELNWVLRQYFPARTRNVLNQLRSVGLTSRAATPAFSHERGDVDLGTLIEITKDGDGTLYVTTDGSDPRTPVASTPSASAVEYAGAIAIDRTHVTIKARVLDGANWSALAEATYYVPELIANLRVTEIMYNPIGNADIEFVELSNLGATPIDLSDIRATRGLQFTFESATTLPPGGIIVLAGNAEEFGSVFPNVEVAGEFVGQLANGGERITLEDALGRTFVDFTYRDSNFWPLSPDGLGFTLVPNWIDRDPNDSEAWRSSADPGGSPGDVDPVPHDGGVVINEVLANSTDPLEDTIELYNPTGSAIDVGGWFLSDSRADLGSLKKFRIPDGTTIEAGGYAVFKESQFNADPNDPSRFALSSGGDQVFLASANQFRDLTGYVTGFSFGASDDGTSIGRIRTSVGLDIAQLRQRSFEGQNGHALVGPVVINEIHYHPVAKDHEFIELHNRSDQDVALFDTELGRGWRIRGLSPRGDDGRFEFPEGTTIPAGGYLVVVASDPLLYRELYPIDESAVIVGPSGGSLDNGGETIALFRPAPPTFEGGEVEFVQVDKVRYGDRGPWPTEPDGQGPSLERIFASSYGNEPIHWAASTESHGTPGARNSASPADANEPPIARFTATPGSAVGPAEIAFDASRSDDVDGTIESWDWNFGDGTNGSGRQVAHPFAETGIFEVTLRVTDNAGLFGEYRALVFIDEEVGPGRILPGDDNADGTVSIADAVSLLNRLFRGEDALPLPCNGEMTDAGNSAVLDINGDTDINLTDAVHLLGYLFRGENAPALGTECVTLEGCPEACVE